MITLRSRVLRAAGMFLGAALLAACGGGGGGGGDGSNASTGGSPPPSDVRVQLSSTAPITAEVMSTEAMRNVTLSGAAIGNFASLNGKTIYIVVEDPASLFEPRAYISGPTNDGRLDVYLTGRTMTTAGTFSGQLTVHVCLDAACGTELAGSPMRVPYDVKVLRGLEVGVETINTASTFGDPTISRSISVRLPEKLKSWAALNTTPFEPLASDLILIENRTTDASSTTGTFTLNVLPALPGIRHGEVTVMATSELNGRTFQYTKKIAVNHTTADNPAVDVVFTPPRLDLTFKQSDGRVHETNYWFVAKPGVSLMKRDVEYLSNPPSANGHRQVQAWFDGFYYLRTAVPCYNTLTTSDCLPPGTYTMASANGSTKYAGNDHPSDPPLAPEARSLDRLRARSANFSPSAMRASTAFASASEATRMCRTSNSCSSA